jgi:uncharacterized protein (DUF1778 family)
VSQVQGGDTVSPRGGARPRAGRPKRPTELATAHIHVLASPVEKLEIVRAADVSGSSASEFMLRAGLAAARRVLKQEKEG